MKVEGNINKAKHVKILEQNLWPVVTKDFFLRGPGSSKMTFVMQFSLHEAVEKTEEYPMHDVAFTKPRYQHDRKCLASTESEPEQQSAGCPFMSRCDIVKEIWVAKQTFSPSIICFQSESDTFAV